jgi:hypothetical protein
VCNLLFLFWIALFPFAAAVFGANIWSDYALGIYWLITSGAAFSMTLTQLMMTRGGGKLVGGIGGRQRFGLILMTLAPALALGMCAYFAFTGQSILARYGWVVMLPAYAIAPMLMRPQSQKAKPKPPNAPKPPARA